MRRRGINLSFVIARSGVGEGPERLPRFGVFWLAHARVGEGLGGGKK